MNVFEEAEKKIEYTFENITKVIKDQNISILDISKKIHTYRCLIDTMLSRKNGYLTNLCKILSAMNLTMVIDDEPICDPQKITKKIKNKIYENRYLREYMHVEAYISKRTLPRIYERNNMQLFTFFKIISALGWNFKIQKKG